MYMYLEIYVPIFLFENNVHISFFLNGKEQEVFKEHSKNQAITYNA